MIERTKARLEQARALLGRFQAEKSRQVQHAKATASPEFFSSLNDFITTARTVIWVLKNEETAKYEAWKSSPGAALNGEEQEVFKLTKCMRNSIEKRGQQGIEARRERVVIPENPDPFSGSQYFGLEDWAGPRR